MTSAVDSGNLDSEAHIKAVEQVEEETMQKRIHAETEEADAQFKYKKLNEKLSESVAVKTKEAENGEHQVVRMKSDLVEAEGDIKSLQEELAASQDYAEKA